MSFKILLILSLIGFVACQGESLPPPPSKNLTIATSLPIGGIDPFTSRSGMGANIIELLYRPLFRLDPNYHITPDFAREVYWEDSRKTNLMVQLNENFAEDVKSSVENARKKASGDLFEGLKNLEVIVVEAPNRVRFSLKKYDRAFPVVMSQIPIVRFSGAQKETGEFRILKQSDAEVVLVRNVESITKVNKIIFQVIPSSRRVMRELVAGNIDFIFFARESDFKVLTDIPGIKIDRIQSRILFQVLENRKGVAKRSNLDWVALGRLIDGQQLVGEVEDSVGYLPEFPVPKEDPWYPKVPEVAVETAPAIFETAYKDKSKRHLSFLGEQSRDRKVARILKRSFESMGVNLNLNDLSPEEFNKEIFIDRNFDLALLPFNVKYTLVSNILVFHSPSDVNSLNFSHYSNELVDRFLDEARYSLNDVEAKNYFSQAMYELSKDPPGIFLFWLKIPIVMRESCSGYRFDTNSEFFTSLKDVRCEPSAVN